MTLSGAGGRYPRALGGLTCCRVGAAEREPVSVCREAADFVPHRVDATRQALWISARKPPLIGADPHVAKIRNSKVVPMVNRVSR